MNEYDVSYSIKEMIAEFRGDVKKDFEEVKQKQDHTNGTVKEHTIQLAMIKGGLLIISIMVVPLLIYVWNQAQENKSNLQILLQDKS